MSKLVGISAGSVLSDMIVASCASCFHLYDAARRFRDGGNVKLLVPHF